MTTPPLAQLPDREVALWDAPEADWRFEPSGESFDVCVIGAGIAGAVTATHLADAGLRVQVVDAATPGAGTTGRSSAKVSVLHGHQAQEIAATSGVETAQAYLRANLFGFEWIADRAEALGDDVSWERRRAVTYANDASHVDALYREQSLLASVGVDSEVGSEHLPWGEHQTLSVDDQAQFDPRRFVHALLSGLMRSGHAVAANTRVTGVDDGPDGTIVHTESGQIAARCVVVTTGLPFLDRGLFFARTVPSSSHVVACRVERMPPDGMYLSAGDPLRSVRTAPASDGDGRVVLVGGEPHRTGVGGDTLERQAKLVAWADEHFGVTEVTHRFMAEDYITPDRVPFAGFLHPGRTSVLVATGFNKWGFTNAPAAAAVISACLGLRDIPEWHTAFSTTRLPLSRLGALMRVQADVSRELASGWIESIRTNPVHPGAPVGGEPRRRCAAAGVCPHLGGIVRWNPASETWDCPLHGSRYEADGGMRHGPSVRDLPRS